jgi:hypothetical protein
MITVDHEDPEADDVEPRIAATGFTGSTRWEVACCWRSESRTAPARRSSRRKEDGKRRDAIDGRSLSTSRSLASASA